MSNTGPRHAMLTARKRIIAAHVASSDLSHDAIAAAMHITRQAFEAKLSERHPNQHFSSVDHTILCDLIPSFATAFAPSKPTTPAPSLELAAVNVAVAGTALVQEVVEAKRDGVVTPSERAEIRRRRESVEMAAQVARATIEAEVIA